MGKGLCISRREGQSIYIGEDIVITVEDLDSSNVGLRISAPPDVSIHREASRVKPGQVLRLAASKIKGR